MELDSRRARQRAANLGAALGFLRLPPTEPELQLLHRWLDTWTGVGLITVGVERRGMRLSLSHIADDEWRAMFMDDNPRLARRGFGVAPTPWRAVQRAVGGVQQGGDAMTDHRITPETGHFSITGHPASLTVTRAAETWQFFAFVFAAAVTLALTLIDEMRNLDWYWRIGAKIVSFFGLAYLLLVNIRVRNWLVLLLGIFKEERR